MTARSSILTIIFFIAINGPVFSQTYNRPAIGLKSHETLEILKVDVTSDKTILYLSVENKIEGGTFCADKNIFLIYPDGSRSKLEKATGIPQCPKYYLFKNKGEKLAFSLTFPVLKPGTGWFNLIEECNNNCFSIYGVLLDDELTRKIEEAIATVDRGEIDSAIDVYKKLVQNTQKSNEGIAGSLYSDLISLLVKRGYPAQASEWYRKLSLSDVPGRQLYINNLNSRGIKF